jgi:dihydropteroate synthase
MAVAPVVRPGWLTARGTLALDRPLIAAILNVTPDSFHDGGRHATMAAAVAHAERLLADGADILDVGGESTRPGASPVDAAAERARVVPVVDAIVRRFPDVPISIDTVKAEVARAALDAGATIINDVSGLRIDPAMGAVVAAAGAGIVLMHSRGTIATMASYTLAQYGEDVVGTIAAELGAAAERALDDGVPHAAIVLDPGLGFSKRTEHSIAVLAHLDRIIGLGWPVLVGPSRKRFVGDVAGGLPAEERLEGTLAACVASLLAGARIFRVHDVVATRRAIAVAEAIREAASGRPAERPADRPYGTAG